MELFKINNGRHAKTHILGPYNHSLCNRASLYKNEDTLDWHSIDGDYQVEFVHVDTYNGKPFKEQNLCPSCVLASYQNGLITLSFTDEASKDPKEWRD